MFTVPREFAEWRIAVDGAAAREWIGGLPALVATLCARWGLDIEDAAPRFGALGPPGLPALRDVAEGIAESLPRGLERGLTIDPLRCERVLAALAS